MDSGTEGTPDLPPHDNTMNGGTGGVPPPATTHRSSSMVDSVVDDGANYTVEDPVVGDSPPPDEAVYDDQGGAYPSEVYDDWGEGGGYIEDTYDADAYTPDEDVYPGDEEEAYDDPYADRPYATENNNTAAANAYDDPYANTPYATDEDGGYVHDPYGEYAVHNGSGTIDQADLEDIEMSKRENSDNIQGGEYELESKDPKSAGAQAFLQRYGKAMGTTLSGFCLVTVLVAIVLVATADSGASHHTTPHHADGSLSPWGRRKDEIHTGTFVPPPLALETVCTRENTATQDGFDACSALCAPAQCCRFDPLEAPHMSCQRGHVQDCHTYHHYCEQPPKAAMIPFTPPPTDIADLCTAEKMHTPEGVTACARACQGGTCCRYPTTLEGLSCLRGNEGSCQVYHQYCEQPPASSTTQAPQHPTHPAAGYVQSFPFTRPPNGISQKCSGERVAKIEGFEECLEICRGGTCCRFDPEREPDLSCRNDHPGDCPVYDQYCGGNSQVVSSEQPHPNGGSGISGNNPHAQTYVEQVCSDHSLATVEGFADCQQACSEHECCWKKEFGTTCPVGTHCEPYSHCLAMEASDHVDTAITVSINLKCTDELVATVQGRKDCLMACSQATCCFGANASSGDECPHAEANENFCDQYAACEKIAHENSIPPAPAQLDQTCAKNHINTLEGLARCDKACSHATCCWQESDNEPSCTKTNPLCADYHACFVLNEGTIVETYPPLPDAPSNLQQQCNGHNGMDNCQQSCAVAECCWKTGTCLHDQPDQCEGYVPCAVLLADIEMAPTNVTNVCDPQAVGTAEGTAACQAVCGAGECCWKTGACLSTQADKCDSYIPCAILMGDDAVTQTPAPMADAPTNVDDVCTRQKVATPDGEMLCADACKPGECCWKSGACLNTHPDTCDGYVPCAILMGDSVALEVAPADLEDTCSSDKISTARGERQCRDSCSAGECCWKDGGCLTTEAEICEGYVPCAILMSLEDEALDAAPVDLVDTCKSDNISTEDGEKACREACSSSECCWKHGTCLSTQLETCEGYVPCAILMSLDDTIDNAPDTLEDTCKSDNIATEAGLQACRDACSDAECCWKDGTCLSIQPLTCEGYVPCAILMSLNSTLDTAPNDLEATCASDNIATDDGLQACQDACSSSECCWKDGTCLSSQSQACEGYIPCAILMSLDDDDDDDTATLAPAPSDLGDLCTRDKLATEVGKMACSVACASSECCWKTGSCLGSQSQTCEGYVPCAILMADETSQETVTVPAAPDFVKDVCTAEKVQNTEGAILCQDACSLGECCWKTGTCLADATTQCEGYIPCAVLIGTGNTDDDSVPTDEVPPVPTYLSTVCANEIAGDEVHGHLCVNACKRADCCWNASSSDPCTTQTYCQGYEICSNVNFGTVVPPTPAPVAPAPTPAPQSGSAPQPTAPAVDNNYSEEMITDACLNHDNSIINLCAKVCEPSDCCFDTAATGGNSCTNDFPCFKYSSCSILHPVDSYVDEQCNTGDLSDCVAACGGSTCCFTTDIDKTCAVTNPNIVCSRYQACEKLYGFNNP